MKFLDLEYDTFGLDINDLSVKMVKLEKKQGKFYLACYTEIEIKPGIVVSGIIKNEKALSDAIKTACASTKRAKLKSKYAVISLPEEESFLQVIQMPKMGYEELKTAVVFEAENYIPLPIEQVYLDFQIIEPLKNSLDHVDVLVVATPKKIVDSYISCIKMAGFIPLSAEVESQSIVRALVKNEVSENPLVLIDVGKNNIEFMVLSGRAIRFTHSIPVSQDQLTSAMSEAMKITLSEAEKAKIKYGLEGSDEKSSAQAKKVFQGMSPVLDELVLQIKKYVDFYQEHASHEHLLSGGKIKKIILLGGGADLKGLNEFLSKKTGVKTETGDPFSNLPLEKDKEGRFPFLSFITALGLAVGGINFEKENHD